MTTQNTGVTVVEYALMLAIIVIAVAIATPKISSTVRGVFSNTTSILEKDYSK